MILFAFFSSNWALTDVSVPNGAWVHFAVVIKPVHPAAVVYINGKQKFISQNNLSVSVTELSTALDDIYLKLNSDMDLGSPDCAFLLKLVAKSQKQTFHLHNMTLCRHTYIRIPHTFGCANRCTHYSVIKIMPCRFL